MRLLIVASIAVLVLAACGGGDSTDSTTPDGSDDVTTTAPSGTAATTTTAAPSSDGGSDERLDVAADALPTEPTGYDTLAADWCALFDPFVISTFMADTAPIVEEVPLDNGCQWKVEGFPNDHYVSVSLGDFQSERDFITSGADGDEKEARTVGDAEVLIKRGIELDIYIEMPDGQYLRVNVYGDYGKPGGPWQETMHYLDPALDALVENITSRL